MTKFEMLFDNGGGILLITDSYCHSYDRAGDAAQDVAELLAGASTDNWDGNQPEYRRDQHDEDDILTMSAARNIYNNGAAWGGRGAAWNSFCRELAEIGQKDRAEKTVERLNEAVELHNIKNFKKWASNTLAELEAPTGDGGLWSCAHTDHVSALRRALRHGDEMRYDLDMAQVNGDASRCEMLTWDIAQRSQAIAEIYSKMESI